MTGLRFFLRVTVILTSAGALRQLAPRAVLCVLLLSFSGYLAALELSSCKNSEGKEIYGADCGFLTLRENPEDIQSALIDVHVMRIASIRSTQNPPIFFINGGPGQAASDLAKDFRHAFSTLLVDHDFIFVDQRGTGKSDPLNCDIDVFDVLDAPEQAQQAVMLDSHRACIASYPHNLSYYSTPYAVSDLEAVKDALNYSSIFLWGGSYGTRVALEYLRSFPESLAGVVLDGVAPTAIQLPFNAERDASRALQKIFSQCESDAACKRAFPTLASSWQSLLTTLHTAPEIKILKHPRTQAEHRVRVSDLLISSWVRMVLYSRDLAPLLPLAIDRASAGDFSQLFAIAAIGSENISKGMSEGLHAAILCMEDYQQHKKIDTQGDPEPTLLKLPAAKQMAALCALYPEGQLPEGYFSTITSSVPTLLLSGNFDPVTPPNWAEQVYPSLSKSRHIVVPGGHHFVSVLGCIPQLMTEFVKRPQELNVLDTSCVDNIKPISFFIDHAGPQMAQQKTPHKKTSHKKPSASVAPPSPDKIGSAP